MRRFSLVPRVGLFAASVAALVGVLFVAALFAILSLRQAESRESRSKDVTVAALRVRTRTADLESALRGYVLSANPRFVGIFRQTRAGVPADLGNLLKLVQDDPPRRTLADGVANELHDYLIDYADNVFLIASVSRGAAADLPPAARRSGGSARSTARSTSCSRRRTCVLSRPRRTRERSSRLLSGSG